MTLSEKNLEEGLDAYPPGNALFISKCRRCGSEYIDRVKKKGREKLLSTIVPLHLYRCEYCSHRNIVFQSEKRLVGLLILPLLLVALLIGYLAIPNPDAGGRQAKSNAAGNGAGNDFVYYDIDYRNRGASQSGNVPSGDVENDVGTPPPRLNNETKTIPGMFGHPVSANAAERMPIGPLVDSGKQQSAGLSSVSSVETDPDAKKDASVQVNAASSIAQKLDELPATASTADVVTALPSALPAQQLIASSTNKAEEESVNQMSENDHISALFELDSDKYTIQISSKRTRIEVTDLITRFSKEMPRPFYYYRSAKQLTDWYPVLYGTYDSRELAEVAIAELPPKLKGGKPFARSIATVKKRARAQ